MTFYGPRSTIKDRKILFTYVPTFFDFFLGGSSTSLGWCSDIWCTTFSLTRPFNQVIMLMLYHNDLMFQTVGNKYWIGVEYYFARKVGDEIVLKSIF